MKEDFSHLGGTGNLGFLHISEVYIQYASKTCENKLVEESTSKLKGRGNILASIFERALATCSVLFVCSSFNSFPLRVSNLPWGYRKFESWCQKCTILRVGLVPMRLHPTFWLFVVLELFH